MNKLAYLKSTRQNLRDSVTYAQNIRQSEFVDKRRSMEEAGKPVEFKHSFGLLCHMHDLRLWTITYAPSNKNNLQRLQELHRINNEALYLIQNSMWKRVMIGVFLWFFVNKLAKSKYVRHGAKDTHDASFRDVTATL